jgi:iron complex outermembrane receptor protein
VFYSVGGSGRLRATVSHKTRLPTLKDRYSFKFGTAQPNPDLRPERSTSFETGYQGVLGARTTFDASVFYARIADLIQSVYLAPNLIQQQNIGRASAAGFEVDARNRAIPHVAVDFNYSFLRRKNTSNPSVLPVDAPRHKGLLSLTVEPLVPVHLVGLVEFESGRVIQNPSGKYLDIGSLATVSAKVVWTVRAPLDLEVAATNLTDENYWIAEGYPEPGRIVRANLRFTF